MSQFFIPAPGGTLTGDGFSLTVSSPSDTRGDTPDFAGDPLEIFAGNGGGNFTVTGNVTTEFTGGSGNDVFTSGGGADSINLGAGDDTAFGGAGDDEIGGGRGNDALFGQAGDDFIFAGGGNDRVVGGAGDDSLFGGGGNDVILGGAGDDFISGGGGADILRGGSGSDTFRINDSKGKNLDLIADFNPDDDLIQLSKKALPGAGKLTAADFAIVDSITTGSAAKLIYDSSTGILYFNPASGDNVALVKLPKGLDNITIDNFKLF